MNKVPFLFPGKRDLGPGECSVQFLKEPMFNTALIIGYYWIPLTILVSLYAQIFHKVFTVRPKSHKIVLLIFYYNPSNLSFLIQFLCFEGMVAEQKIVGQRKRA